MKINIHTSHASAFISSTFIDLKQERNAVSRVLANSGLNVNALDVKPASNDSSRKAILTGIEESDFIILIIGQRYGSIIPQMTVSKTLSVTRWEYIMAKKYDKHALVYFKQVQSNEKIFYDDRLPIDFEMKQTQLAEFKKQLSASHNPKFFTTADELAEEVRKAIIPTYRAGVKSLAARNESLMKEVAALKQKTETRSAPSLAIEDSKPGLTTQGGYPVTKQGNGAFGLSGTATPTIGFGLMVGGKKE